jgi:predicted GNAT family acetyltransferase
MNSRSIDVMVHHNAAENRFEADVEGQLSVADYQLRGTEMIMTHTFVPPHLRGRGIAEKLVRVALEHARSERLKVVPACSYVDAFIRRHPEYHPLLME